MSKRGKETTDPWDRDEYCYVDGVPYVYTREVDSMLVRFPGGGAATPEQLVKGGCAFTYPKRARGFAEGSLV